MPRNQVIQKGSQGIWVIWLVVVLVGVALLAGAALPASASDDVADPIADAVRKALDGWAEYASTGDLLALGTSFVRGGPQYQQLVAESAIGQPSRPEAPLHFDVHAFQLRSLDTAAATVWVEVEAKRDGFVSDVFGWDFDLIREGDRWRVWTVVPAVEPPESVQLPAVDVATTTSTTTTTLASTAALAGPVDEELVGAAAPGSVRGTRIPVVSAWVVVVTVVGVALAGYMAPRIDRRREG